MKTNPFKPSKAVLAFALGLLLVACESEAERKTKADAQAHQEKYAKAKALFEERCKTAGVVIHRTVKDVEGIELTKVRQPIPFAGKEYFDPMWSEAAMAGEVRGDSYTLQFLSKEFRYQHSPDRRGDLAHPGVTTGHQQLPPILGYRFVELRDAGSSSVSRCVATHAKDAKSAADLFMCSPVEKASSRFALDFEDIVDPADRALWVAGTRLKVIDKEAGEVIAELKRFVWDPGFGGSSSGRWPWQHATSAASTVCPSDSSQPLHHDSRYFIDQVLVPKQAD